jgi:hypothetical protein
MRTPCRDRCGPGIVALCIVLIFACPAAAALTAEFAVFQNGTAYKASVEVAGVSDYEFVRLGLLGEKTDIDAQNIRLNTTGGEVEFERSGSRITFPEGNYTIHYAAPIQNNDLRVDFSQPYNVTFKLPAGLKVQNPLLGMISTGGHAEKENDSVILRWEDAYYAECRFYTDTQERALVIFGTFWIALCAFFVTPFLISRRRGRN